MDSLVATVSVRLATPAFISAKTIYSLCFLAAKLVCFVLADVKFGLSFEKSCRVVGVVMVIIVVIVVMVIIVALLSWLS